MQTGGMAVREAALALVERGRDAAAGHLGVARDEVEYTAGRFRSATGHIVYWTELAAANDLSVEATFQPSAATCPFGAHWRWCRSTPRPVR